MPRKHRALLRKALWVTWLLVGLSACAGGPRLAVNGVRTRALGPEVADPRTDGTKFHHTAEHPQEPGTYEVVALAAAEPAALHPLPPRNKPPAANLTTGLKQAMPQTPSGVPPLAMLPGNSTHLFPDRDPDNLIHRPGLQPLSIPSLVLVLGAITLAFLSNNGALVAGMLALGLLLAGISLSRIRSRERAGKVFALIAMVVGTVAALITTMVIIRTGF